MGSIAFFAVFILILFDGIIAGCGCKKSKLKRGLTMKVGDMILTAADIMKIEGFRGYRRGLNKWPDNIVRYAFDDQYPEKSKQIIRDSLNDLVRDLGECVQYIEDDSKYYIKIENLPGGCSSYVGRVHFNQGFQTLNLESPGCLSNNGTIKHEFIHALGFLHTQMRKDRDSHIRIFWDRIDSNFCSEFVTCRWCEETVPYKTTSVMHYPSYAFACPGQDVVVEDINGKWIEYNLNTIPEDIKMIKDYLC